MEDRDRENGAGPTEVVAELESGDVALVFRHGGSEVEVFHQEGGSDEERIRARTVIDFVQFVLNSDECWSLYAESINEPARPSPSTLN